MQRWICASTALLIGFSQASAQNAPLTGEAAFGDWRSDKPGVVRLIRPADLPKPGATASASNSSRVVPRPASAAPLVPRDFKVELFADGLSGPRQMRLAPNGDIFVAETDAGRIRVLRPTSGWLKTRGQRNLCQQARCTVRDRVLPERRQPEMGLRGEHQQRHSLSLYIRRHQGHRQAGNRDRFACRKAATPPGTSSSARTTSR